jgi:DedD protein
MAETEEVEQLRRRARRRLVGAAAVVLFLVIVPPMLMDLEPKPVSSNLSVEIPPPAPIQRDSHAAVPARDDVAGRGPAPAVSASAAASGKDLPALAVQAGPAGDSVTVKPESAAVADAAAKDAASGKEPAAGKDAASVKQSPAATDTSATKDADAAKDAPKDATSKDATSKDAAAGDAAKDSSSAKDAAAAPSGSDAAKQVAAAAETSASEAVVYVIPLGSFAAREHAQQLVRKAGQLGIKVYSEKVATPAGERTRVSAGPYPSREAAEKARSALREAGIQAAAIRRSEKRG